MQEDLIRLRWVSTAFRSSGCSERNSSRVVWRKRNHDLSVSMIALFLGLLFEQFSLYTWWMYTSQKHVPLLSGPVRAASLLFYSSVQELHLLPWTRTPPVSHSALCSAGAPLPTSLLTSAEAAGPGVPARTGGRWILQREIRTGSNKLKSEMGTWCTLTAVTREHSSLLMCEHMKFWWWRCLRDWI